MDESLRNISECILWYQTHKHASGGELVEILRVISTHVYTLEHHRVNAKERYEQEVFNNVSEGLSVARSVNIAEVEVPELYKLRRIIDQSNRVCDAIRTQISLLKAEMNVNHV